MPIKDRLTAALSGIGADKFQHYFIGSLAAATGAGTGTTAFAWRAAV